MTERDLYNTCVQSFVDHNYDAALLIANNLVKQGTLFPIHMVLLLSAKHLGENDIVDKVGAQILLAGSV
ncbi:MAG TPA: hypothetical protein VEU11_05935 [Terriglobales bacterium]|nr:hypothetical protein [Terriglobales bacterium]